MANTLIYSPRVEIHIERSNGEIVDVSSDVTRCTLTLRVNGISGCQFNLMNAVRKYDGLFSPMDKVVIYMTRVRRMLVFSGYLDQVPIFSAYPGDVPLEASSTLKRLQNFYWDVDVPQSRVLLKGDPSQSNKLDGGISKMVTSILTDVVGWPAEAIHIGGVPETWFDSIGALVDRLVAEAEKNEMTTAVGSAVIGGNGIAVTPADGTVVSAIIAAALSAGVDPVFAIGVAIQESTLNPRAQNGTGLHNGHYGIYQMQMAGAPYGGSGLPDRPTVEQAFDPVYASNLFMKAAVIQANRKPQYRDRANWQAWYWAIQGNPGQGDVMSFMPEAQRLYDANPTKNAGAVAANGTNATTSGLGGVAGAAPAAPTAAPTVATNGPALPPPPPGELPYLSMGRQLKRAFPDAVLTAQKDDHVNDGGHHPKGQAIDIDGPDNQAIADWIFKAYPNSTQLIWGPGPLIYKDRGTNIDNADQAQLRGIYAGDLGGHYDHVHWASVNQVGEPGVAGPGGSGSGSTSAGGMATSNSVGDAIFNVFQWLGNEGLNIASTLSGIRALMNDVPVLGSIDKLMKAGVRQYTAAPNGDFIGWFPDYFGQWGTAAKMVIQDIELMEGFSVAWSDSHLKTHIFVTSSLSGKESMNNAGSYTQAFSTAGIASVEYPELMEALFKVTPERFDFKDSGIQFLARYGARPEWEAMAELNGAGMGIFAKRAEFFFAVQSFMKNWASQFSARVNITFMPEVFPGMLLVFPSYGVQGYVQEVTHDYDSEGGFTTSPSVIAWSNIGGEIEAPGIDGLPRGGSL